MKKLTLQAIFTATVLVAGLLAFNVGTQAFAGVSGEECGSDKAQKKLDKWQEAEAKAIEKQAEADAAFDAMLEDFTEENVKEWDKAQEKANKAWEKADKKYGDYLKQLAKEGCPFPGEECEVGEGGCGDPLPFCFECEDIALAEVDACFAAGDACPFINDLGGYFDLVFADCLLLCIDGDV